MSSSSAASHQKMRGTGGANAYVNERLDSLVVENRGWDSHVDLAEFLARQMNSGGN